MSMDAKLIAKAKLRQEAMDYHTSFPYGKVYITSKDCSQDQLRYAYSPGVGEVCLAVQNDPSLARTVTMKGNNVCVITNGTAILGLGDIGALAGKPVMEGKALLMHKLAGIDSTDLCIQEKNIDKLVEIITPCADSFGCINLEDIAAPGCFELLERLSNTLDIPVFHDDQDGTACAVAAGMLNALYLINKKMDEIKVVCSGAGAAMLATLRLLREFGLKRENIIIFDSKGCIHSGRSDLNKQKSEYAVDKDYSDLMEALNGADVFIGLSVGEMLKGEDLVGMNKNPILFTMANPTPEIMPDIARAARPDAIIATGRSDFPNQVNNSVCFPYLFRATLDLRAKKITLNMMKAFVEGLVELSRSENDFGVEKILPYTLDQRIFYAVINKIMIAAVKENNCDKPDYRVMHMYMYRNSVWNDINALPSINRVEVEGGDALWLKDYIGVFSDDSSKSVWKIECLDSLNDDALNINIDNLDNGYCAIYRNGLDIFTVSKEVSDSILLNIPNYHLDTKVLGKICEFIGIIDMKNHTVKMNNDLKKVMFMTALCSKI